ncbi:hypothetical protein ACFXHA_25470 [Nocardia sp. NPDC059240]
MLSALIGSSTATYPAAVLSTALGSAAGWAGLATGLGALAKP